MRIITGEYKGRRLEMPIGNDIRPTTEKVKEAIFSTIAPYIYGSRVVDLFTGTGNLGLEALSRGADFCYFCDNARDSLKLTERNIKMCRAEEKSMLVAGDFTRALARLSERNEKIDIFFLDPPYREGLYEKCFMLIKEYDLLADDGIILAEHGTRDKFETEIEGFKMIKEKVFGNVTFTIYEHA